MAARRLRVHFPTPSREDRDALSAAWAVRLPARATLPLPWVGVEGGIVMQEKMKHAGSHGRTYIRFAAMIATSTVVMFVLTYVNTLQTDHIFWSETRLYMSLLMGAAMAVVMLTFMLHMHKSRPANIAIYAGAATLFALALYLVRSQATIEDVSYMRAMIPHHSIAILTSERAHISDPRVRKLADGIIESQRREIAEMKALIADLHSK